MSRRCLCSLALLGVLCASSTTARADQQRRIGVVVTVLVNVSDAEATKVATELGEALRKERPVDVIAGAETTRRLPASGIPDECVAKPTCRNDIGRRLDADELLMLVIVKLGDKIQIDATWANVASGKVTSRPQIVLMPGTDRTATFAKAVPRLVPHIAKKPVKTGPNIIIVPTQAAAPARRRHFTTPGWIAAGIAAASFVGGGVLALSAQQKYTALEDDGCRERECSQSRIDSLRFRTRAADLLFVVGTGAAVTSLVLYLRSGTSASTEERKPPQVQVGVTRGRVHLGLGGSF